jgi:hypothetical protein
VHDQYRLSHHCVIARTSATSNEPYPVEHPCHCDTPLSCSSAVKPLRGYFDSLAPLRLPHAQLFTLMESGGFRQRLVFPSQLDYAVRTTGRP